VLKAAEAQANPVPGSLDEKGEDGAISYCKDGIFSPLFLFI
jgi:hypothetical protein